MQYALFPINEDRKMVLLDINEYAALDEHHDTIQDLEEDETTMALKIVYGSYKPLPGVDAEKAVSDITEIKGYELGHIDDKTCRAIEFCDFHSYDPIYRGKALDIPFAALIRTHIEIPSGKTQAVTAFVRYKTQMSPATNILNRPGLFAIKAQEKRVTDIDQQNWHTHIDEERMLRSAATAI
jgi:hypothetical protein